MTLAPEDYPTTGTAIENVVDRTGLAPRACNVCLGGLKCSALVLWPTLHRFRLSASNGSGHALSLMRNTNRCLRWVIRVSFRELHGRYAEQADLGRGR
jgi:hypothetical protein